MTPDTLVSRWARAHRGRTLDLLFAQLWIADIDVRQPAQDAAPDRDGASFHVVAGVPVVISACVRSVFPIAGIVVAASVTTDAATTTVPGELNDNRLTVVLPPVQHSVVDVGLRLLLDGALAADVVSVQLRRKGFAQEIQRKGKR